MITCFRSSSFLRFLMGMKLVRWIWQGFDSPREKFSHDLAKVWRNPEHSHLSEMQPSNLPSAKARINQTSQNARFEDGSTLNRQ